MNKKLLVLLLLTLLIFVSWQHFSGKSSQPETRPQTPSPGIVEETPSVWAHIQERHNTEAMQACLPEAIDTCLNNHLFNNDNIALTMRVCDDFLIPSNAENCRRNIINQRASAQQDSTQCERLENANDVNLCKLEVLVQQAVSEENTNACKKLEAPALLDQCITSLAQRLRREEFCKLITKEETQIQCTETVLIDIETLPPLGTPIPEEITEEPVQAPVIETPEVQEAPLEIDVLRGEIDAILNASPTATIENNADLAKLQKSIEAYYQANPVAEAPADSGTIEIIDEPIPDPIAPTTP